MEQEDSCDVVFLYNFIHRFFKIMEKNFKILKIILTLTACIGFISILTPVMSHKSPNFLYHFWSFGFAFGSALRSSEITVYFISDITFLIPALSSDIIIVLSSSLILKSLFKSSSNDEFKRKIAILGAILMISTPIILMIILHLIYTIGVNYPEFWALSTYMPSFSIYLRFIAGIIALTISLVIKKKN